MVNSKVKLSGDTPPIQVRIVWTAGSVEPDYKWMIHLSGSTEPVVHTIRNLLLGRVSPRSFPLEFTMGWLSLG